MNSRRSRSSSSVIKTIAVVFGFVWTSVMWLQYKANFANTNCLPGERAGLYGKDVDLKISTRKHAESPVVKFVIVLGLEGTGHHFFQSLYLSSPSYRTIQRYGLTNVETTKLMMNLYNDHDKETGIWSAPCADDELLNVTNATEQSFHQVVESLKSIQENILLRNSQGSRFQSSPGTATAVAVNSIENQLFGMMSFPNFLGDCRPLQYPDLGSLYDACKKAKVQCQHILMYRNPYETVRSTTIGRKPNMTESAKLRQIQILSTMLDVIHGQLLDFPEHLAACWNYSSNLVEGKDAMNVGQLLGWDKDSLMTYYTQESAKHKSSVSLHENEKSIIVPPPLQLFMNRLIRANERVAKTCKRQLNRLI